MGANYRLLLLYTFFLTLNTGLCLNCGKIYGTHRCWDGTAQWFGCCATGPCNIFCGNCDGRCRGWGVRFHHQSHFSGILIDSLMEMNLGSGSTVGVTELNGADTTCHSVYAISVETKGESCVKLWEYSGCQGKHITLRDGTINDIKNYDGWEAIYGISGCEFQQPTKVKVKITF